MSEHITNLVTPLAHKATAMPVTDTAISKDGASEAVTAPSIRRGDVDSVLEPQTLIMPSSRASTTATRIGITSATTITGSLSADYYDTDLPVPFERAELIEAYRDARNGKRNSKSAIEFESNLERNICQLYEELIGYKYKPSRSICFVIHHPKLREVWAPAFRDRIVHHLIYNRIGPRFERTFIADTCACINGRGTKYGAERLEAKIRSITQNWSRNAFYLKADVANFFVSIDKNILWELLYTKIPETWFRWVTEVVLFHDPRQDVEFRGGGFDLVPEHKRLMLQPVNRGLPIGNLDSQFFANVYLNEPDQFAKHRLGVLHYIRYVDDFVLLHESPQQLNEWYYAIAYFIESRLGIRLNHKKKILQPIPRGVDFVGQVIAPWNRTLRETTLQNAIFMLATMPEDEFFESANSYFGLARQCTHGHEHRVQIARIALKRGFVVNGDLTKVYRRD